MLVATKTQDMQGLIIVLVLTLNVGQLLAQVKCYLSSEDLLDGYYSSESVTPVIKDSGSDFVFIPKMLDGEGRKSKASSLAMAIELDGITYVNFRYCIPYQNVEVFVRPEFVGGYTVVVIDERTSSRVRNGGNSYGGGLQGVLIKESGRWGSNWIDRRGDQKRIILFDLLQPSLVGGRSTGNLLTRRTFNALLSLDYSEKQIDRLNFEEVMQIVWEQNR